MRKLLPLLLFASLVASIQAAELKPMEMPPEKFSVDRLKALSAAEEKARFPALWFAFKQQYDFKDGKFAKKDGKSAKRFPLEVRVVAKLSDKKWYCLLEGASPTYLVVETAAPAEFELNKTVNFWVEDAGTETYRSTSFKKYKESVPSSLKKEDATPPPKEAELQKAFIDAIGKGETFVVDVIEQRNCPTCRGTGRIERPSNSGTSKGTALSGDRIPCPDSNGLGKRPAKIAVTLMK